MPDRSGAPRSAVPWSTKLLTLIGVLLVLAGLALGAWDKLLGSRDEQAQSVVIGEMAEALPGLDLLLPGLAVLLVVVCLIGLAVVSRNKPPTR